MKRKRIIPFHTFTPAIKDCSGFSLIEIMTATLIASIILVMTYTAYHSIGKTVREVSGYTEFYINLNMAVSAITRDIGNMYQNSDRKNCSLYGDTEDGNSFLHFITYDRRSFLAAGDLKKFSPVSDVNETEFYLKPDPEYSGMFFLMKRQANGYDENLTEGGSSGLLLENVLELKFEFRSGNDWTARWDSRETKKYPAGIRTTLRLKNYSGKEEQISFICLPDMNGK